MIEKTLFMIKPSGMQPYNDEGIILKDRILETVCTIGTLNPLNIVEYDQAPMEQVAQHYEEHNGKPFFDWVIAEFEGKSILTGILEGDDVIAKLVHITGDTDPQDAASNTIRRWAYDLFKENMHDANYEKRACRNLIHRARSKDAFIEETAIWYPGQFHN